jgi:ribosomal RNA-processing protein 8
MFTVPGWNVSAPIASQAEQPKAKNPNKQGKKALKRKEKQEQQANAENLGELWDKVLEAKDAKPLEEPSAAPAATSTAAPDGVEATGEETQEKRGKKRKRGKSAKQKAEEALAKEGAAPIADGETKAGATDASAPKPTTADSEAKRDKKKRKKDNKSGDNAATKAIEAAQPLPAAALIPEPAGLTPLQRSMRAKLASARFRHLNESLYTKPSLESLSLFKEDPSMFEDYHRGFAQQVEVWPSNPVDGYVTSVLSRGKVRNRDPWKEQKRQAKKGGKPQEEAAPEATSGGRLTGDSKPLPRDHKYHATIADLGCGTASLSYRLQPHLNDLHLTIHSFDLSKPTGPSAPLVTVADVSALPLADNSVDVAIFCLALMGTNWLDFIDEAYRILRWRGELWVSEIKSRFGRVDKKTANAPPINSIGSLKKPDKKKKKDKPDDDGIAGSADESELAERVDGADPQNGTHVAAFLDVLRKRGFVLDALPERQSDAIDLSNKMFVKMQFTKSAQPVRGKNAKEGAGAGAGPQRTNGFGDRGIKFGIKGKKYGVVAEDGGKEDEREMKVLKPCLYKIR